MFSSIRNAVRLASVVAARRCSSVNEAHFLLTATGVDRVGIVSDVAKAVLNHGGDIAESRMVRMGGDFTIMMRFSCHASVVPAFTHDISNVPNTKCYLHEVSARQFDVSPRPDYRAHFRLEGANEPGLLFQLADLFRQHNLRIEQMSSEMATAPWGGTTLFMLDGTVECDSHVDEQKLRREVDALAEDLNLDIVLSEPMAAVHEKAADDIQGRRRMNA